MSASTVYTLLPRSFIRRNFTLLNLFEICVSDYYKWLVVNHMIPQTSFQTKCLFFDGLMIFACDICKFKRQLNITPNKTSNRTRTFSSIKFPLFSHFA